MQKNIFIILTCLLLCQSGLYSQRYFALRKLPFNHSATQEFGAAFYNNGIIFCSDRRNRYFTNYTDLQNKIPTKIYWSEQKKPGKFSGGEEFARELRTNYWHGPVTFSKDGKVMYFTRTIDVEKKRGNSLRGDTAYGIFRAEWVNGSWRNVTPLPFNRLNNLTGFPCLSEDGQQLFFCSTDARGYGGFDIYVSYAKNGQFTNYENLGPVINTPENDLFPFLHKSGRLYFASRGHGGKGGLDIFYSDFIDGAWQEPIALPEPFNSQYDDFGLIFNDSFDTAFFTSTRGNSMDVFIAYSTLPVFETCNQQEENDYCYTFYEKRQLEIDTTMFDYEWDFGDGTRERGLEARHCYEKTGNYTVQLNIIDLVTKEVYFNEATYIMNVEDIIQPYITAVDTAYVGEEVKFSALKSNLNFEIAGYYWNFEDAARAENAEVVHIFNKPGVYSVKLGVTSTVKNEKTTPEKACVSKNIKILKR